MTASADSNRGDQFGQLIEKARCGDQEALGELLQECRQYLLLVANVDLDSQVRPKIAASDLVQESLLTAQAAFHQFQGHGREELFAWIRQILKNDLLQAHRYYVQTAKRQINREYPIDDSRQIGTRLPDHATTPSTQAGLREESQLLEQAMADLSDDYQQVLRLRNWEKLTYAEIGVRTGRSEEAVRKIWARAIVSLKDRMQPTRDASE